MSTALVANMATAKTTHGTSTWKKVWKRSLAKKEKMPTREASKTM
ncbi:Uncharacterised protein [Mycobacteroides abscessus subsp. abscessus]|nr:Uncharacterised protein [Mycobacteroides abscessus subsp. abscessus]